MDVYHGVTIGADGYVIQAPVANPGGGAGCALVYNATGPKLEWTARPVLIEPASSAGANTDYLSPTGWRTIPAPDLSSKVSISGDTMTGALVTPVLKLGGATASYPALKPNSDTIQVRLADDSGYGSLECDWNMVRSTFSLGTSNPSSYGRASYTSNSWRLYKQDTTYAKLTLSEIELNNGGVASLSLTSTGTYGAVSSLASNGLWLQEGGIVVKDTTAGFFNLALGKDNRLSWSPNANNAYSAAADVSLARVSSGLLGVYTSATGTTHGDIRASKFYTYNVAGSPSIEANSNSGIRALNSSGSLGSMMSHECVVDSTGYFYVGGRGTITSSANGVMHVQNYDFNDVTADQALALGPATTTTNGVRLKRAMGSTTVQVRNGNDTDYATIEAGQLWLKGNQTLNETTYLSRLGLNIGGGGYSVVKIGGVFQSSETLVGIGGIGATFPALRRKGTVLEARLADDSAYTDFKASRLYATPSSGSDCLTVEAAYPYITLKTQGWAGSPDSYIQTGSNALGDGAGNFMTFIASVGKSISFNSGNPGTTGKHHLAIDGTTSNATFTGAITSTTTGHTDTFSTPGNATAQLQLTNDGGSLGFHHHYYPAQQIDRWVWRVTPNATYVSGGAKHLAVGYLYNQAVIETDMGLQFSTAGMILAQSSGSLTWNFQGSTQSMHWINNGGAANEVSMKIVSNAGFYVQTGYGGTDLLKVTSDGTITQTSSTRWTIPATGQRKSEVGNGSGTWQTGYREEYNAAGLRCAFYGGTPVAIQSLPAAATDAATTQSLANAIRTALIALNLAA